MTAAFDPDFSMAPTYLPVNPSLTHFVLSFCPHHLIDIFMCFTSHSSASLRIPELILAHFHTK